MNSPSLQLAATRSDLVLKSILEVGRIFLADFTEEYRLYKDVTIQEVGEPLTVPFAIFRGDKDGYACAYLTAILIAERFPTGEIVLPDFMFDGLYIGGVADEDAEGFGGNTGTKDDSATPRLVRPDGRPL